MASLKYLPVLPWVLPLALSFYGFQSLTYTIDLYRRDSKPAESYLAYLAWGFCAGQAGDWCTLRVRGGQRVTGMRRDGREAAVPSRFESEERPGPGRFAVTTHTFPGLERSSPCSITGGTMP